LLVVGLASTCDAIEPNATATAEAIKVLRIVESPKGWMKSAFTELPAWRKPCRSASLQMPYLPRSNRNLLI
jgi:hypothetical protein